MSDENTKPVSSTEQMIPKSRLDELIARANAAEQKAQFFQQTATSLMQQQRAARPPDPEDAEIERLKEENPLAYKLHLKQKKAEQDLKQVRAGFSSLADQIDRTEFLRQAGKDGQKYAEKVEQIIQTERGRGNFNVDRHGAYVYLRGQEQLLKDRQTQATPPAATQVTDEGDAPGSDPQFASTLRQSAAPTATVEKSREERFKELENQEF